MVFLISTENDGLKSEIIISIHTPTQGVTQLGPTLTG